MAIGAITMILANVGLQIYNNWCGSRQNAALQQKREEFERAAKERNTEHMWQLMREGQELSLQLEHEKHADRLNELKDEVDHLLEKLTYETTISNWPLKVLPIVMKNQAFGNLLTNQEENVAMHVIFTRSNYDQFNKLAYPIIEKQLEQYCDKHWSTMTDHPVLFYSGAWKPAVNPTDVQVTAMREELKNLPTLLITPFFRPNDGKLVFQLHMWGVGANSTDKFDVPEIEPTDFQRTFTNQDDYDNEEGLLEEIVEDLVPYLECMIGYMADTYFWSSAGLAPHLPLLLTNGVINTDGMKYLINDSREYYDGLLEESEEKAKENPFMHNKLYNLIEGSASLWSDKDNLEKREKSLSINKKLMDVDNKEYNNILQRFHDKYISIIGGKENLGFSNLAFLKKIRELGTNQSLDNTIQDEINYITDNENFEVWFCASRNELLQRIINRQEQHEINAISFGIERKNEFVSIGAFYNVQNEIVYSLDNIGIYIILMDNHHNKGSYVLDVSTLTSKEKTIKPIFNDLDYNLLKKIYEEKTFWLNKLIEQHRSMNDIVSSYLADAPIRNVSYNDLKKWSLSNSHSSMNANFVIGYNPKVALYYIVGLTSNRKSVYASYCNTMNENLIARFGNKLLLTIKTTNNGI